MEEGWRAHPTTTAGFVPHLACKHDSKGDRSFITFAKALLCTALNNEPSYGVSRTLLLPTMGDAESIHSSIMQHWSIETVSLSYVIAVTGSYCSECHRFHHHCRLCILVVTL